MSTKVDRAEETIEIKKTIIINASSEVVFNAITSPTELTHWFPDNAVFEGRIGGQVRFSFYKEHSTKHSEGIVKEFVPNKKVSYTWQPGDKPGFPETTVTWELEEINLQKTKVELVHSGFTGRGENKQSSKEYDQGWSYFLGRLKDYCEKESN
jgi:uncharacterized protein YndB with AHSA1/START domain